jgi:hypothetical protein
VSGEVLDLRFKRRDSAQRGGGKWRDAILQRIGDAVFFRWSDSVHDGQARIPMNFHSNKHRLQRERGIRMSRLFRAWNLFDD